MRPMEAKFHKYADREKVRGYNMREDLQPKKVAVKLQLPNSVIQRRKKLSHVFEQAKKDGRTQNLSWINYTLMV